jgi:hypothetical protein
MGREFFASAGMADFAEWDDASFSFSALAIIEGRVLGAVYVAVIEGKIVGMTGGMVFPLYCNFSVMIGQEIFWWANPDSPAGTGAMLLDELEADATRKGAALFISAQIAGQRDAAFARVYARRGYRPSENTFIRRLAS